MTALCSDDEYKGPERRTRCDHADEAAEKAVKKTFAILGVDIDQPKEVREFQESLRFGDKLRKAADKGTLAFIVAFATLIGAAMWAGFKLSIAGGS